MRCRIRRSLPGVAYRSPLYPYATSTRPAVSTNPSSSSVLPSKTIASQEKHIVSHDATAYPSSLRLAAVVASLALAVFLYGLDQTIIGTAIPKITDHFHALGDIGWSAAAYLFTSSAFQLLFGKLFTIFSIRVVYLVAVADTMYIGRSCPPSAMFLLSFEDWEQGNSTLLF
jgi:hypothetical protein